ncbi:MAG: hypothetical protein IJ489_04765 [Clostridia bacterium]|nr:hypothetical protein [Clostridia bacterium]
MYSRSYGSIETDRKPEEFSIPPDYNGSLYRRQPSRAEPPKKTEVLPEKEEAPILPPPAPAPRTNGTLGSLLEKFSAEDIILFVLVFSLLKEDNEDPETILAVILALLLL